VHCFLSLSLSFLVDGRVITPIHFRKSQRCRGSVVKTWTDTCDELPGTGSRVCSALLGWWVQRWATSDCRTLLVKSFDRFCYCLAGWYTCLVQWHILLHQFRITDPSKDVDIWVVEHLFFSSQNLQLLVYDFLLIQHYTKLLWLLNHRLLQL